MRIFPSWCCLVGIVCGGGMTARAAHLRPMGTLPLGDATVRVAEETLQHCLAGLTGDERAHFLHRDRLRLVLAGSARVRWRECVARERERDDAAAVVWLGAALRRMNPDPAAAAEADRLAAQLVRATRALAERYRMVGSPLVNNMLVRVGAKERGYCYHWTTDLLRALSAERWVYFARVWGGANVGAAAENNAVIITARGAPLSHGLVYDVWRGIGRPWWRSVAADHYRWAERYGEVELHAESTLFAEE